jgi:UDP-2,3-diacylglucosamine pyrophosphatase LpxH
MEADTEHSVADLLQACEAPDSYANPLVQWDANGAEIIVISDLHIGPGRDPNGCFLGTESFFADAALARFLRYAPKLVKQPAILIINGDLVDFIRTTDIPATDADFDIWQGQLEALGIEKTTDQLRSSISPKERKFGLGTEDYKSVWKLHRVVRGHPLLFDALADWLACGNRLFLVKGNHDLELFWPAIRNCLRLALAQRISASLKTSESDALKTYIQRNLLFIDDALIIDDDFYIEHGHRYDRYARVLGPSVLHGSKDAPPQLNLPFGLFLNRYVLNRVELAFPYTDNVRPTSNLLPMLIRERFPVALKLFFNYMPLLGRMMFKRPLKTYLRYIFGRFIWMALAILVPLLIAAIILLAMVPGLPNALHRLPNFMNFPGAKVLGSIASLAASYFLSRFVAYFQLSEPDTLASDARDLFDDNPAYRIITMGHTHNPDQFFNGSKAYFNTGTWIPIIETDVAQVREDRTYTFLLLRRGSDGSLQPGVLQRWNDDAGRVEDLIIRQPKDA